MSKQTVTIGDVNFVYDDTITNASEIATTLNNFQQIPELGKALTGLSFLLPDGSPNQVGDKLTVEIGTSAASATQTSWGTVLQTIAGDDKSYRYADAHINLNVFSGSNGIDAVTYVDQSLPAGQYSGTKVAGIDEINAADALWHEIGHIVLKTNPDYVPPGYTNSTFNDQFGDPPGNGQSGANHNHNYAIAFENLMHEYDGTPLRQYEASSRVVGDRDPTHLFPTNAEWAAIVLRAQISFISANIGNIGLDTNHAPGGSSLAPWLQYIGHGLGYLPNFLLPGPIEQIKALFDLATKRSSPLVLDLDGDGIHTTALSESSHTYFDLNGNGFATQTGWISPTDGFLSIDSNHNGRIDNASELFGSAVGGGFAALANYDTNHDGKLSSDDMQWSDLKIWIDQNSDGVSQAYEIRSLDSLNITSISLSNTDAALSDNGNLITQIGSFTMDDGSGAINHAIEDVWFATDTANTRYAMDYTLDELAGYLPSSRGYGALPDLHIAMSLDNNLGDTSSLLSQVDMLSSKSFSNIFTSDSTVMDAVTSIMYKWAGVEDVSSTSRGPYVDGQQLAFLETIMGQDFLQHGYMTDPRPQAGQDLSVAFQEAQNHIAAMLMGQTAAITLFQGTNISYNITTDSFEGITGLNITILNSLISEASTLSNVTQKDTFWQNVVRFVDGVYGVSNLSSSDNLALSNAIHNSDSSLSLTQEVNRLA